MLDNRSSELGAALLRMTLGVMYLAHGVLLKVWTYGFDGTAAYFESIGLPSALAYAVILAETAGGLLLLLDVRTRFVATALLPILLGATWAHGGNGWVFSNAGGGWEYPLFLTVVSVVVALQASSVKATARAAGAAYGEAA